MAKVVNQNIPAEMADAYDQTLHRSAIWIPGSSIRVVRKRVPFELKPMRNLSLSTPSAEQRKVRRAFKSCVVCYNAQPYEDGAVPPAEGPRNRSWWFDAAVGSGLWYYDYFIQQTWQGFYDGPVPVWCKIGAANLIAGNKVRADLPNQVDNVLQPRPIFNAEGLPHSEAFYQFDLTPAALSADVPDWYPGKIKGATLHCWMYNEMIYDLDIMAFKNQTGRVYVGQVDYWDPAAATWNNKPTTPPETFSRTSYVYEGPEGPTNELFTEHWIDISSQVLDAIAAESPYLTIAHKITPYITGDYSGFDPTWMLGSSPAEYHPEIIFR